MPRQYFFYLKIFCFGYWVEAPNTPGRFCPPPPVLLTPSCLWRRRPQNLHNSYYNLLCVLSVLIPFFQQRTLFWIPVMKPESNFDYVYTGDPYGLCTPLVTFILFDKIGIYVHRWEIVVKQTDIKTNFIHNILLFVHN